MIIKNFYKFKMKENKCIISKGKIDKYILFAVIGGVSKCIVGIMLYIFEDYANYNKHPIIIGFNAGIGMSFSLIPYLMVKLNSKRENSNNKAKVVQALTIKNTNSFKKKNLLDDLEYLHQYSKLKLRTQKFLILLACAFLDFAQKFLTFFLKKYIINNIWIFNILFISIFDYFINKNTLYKHQYISSLIIIFLGIAATVIGLYGEEGDIFIKFILCVSIEIMYSLAIVLSKYLMDHRSCSPFEVTFYEGIFALIVNSVLLGIFTNMPLSSDEGLTDILRLTYYEGKIYLDNFYATFNNMGIGESFLFLLSAIGRLISNLFGHIVVKHYTSSHIILVLVLGEISLVFKESTEWPNIVQFSLFCLVLLMLLVFTEIIEINACNLEKNTRKNIEMRVNNESKVDDNIYDINSEKSDENKNLNESMELSVSYDSDSGSYKGQTIN